MKLNVDREKNVDLGPAFNYSGDVCMPANTWAYRLTDMDHTWFNRHNSGSGAPILIQALLVQNPRSRIRDNPQNAPQVIIISFHSLRHTQNKLSFELFVLTCWDLQLFQKNVLLWNLSATSVLKPWKSERLNISWLHCGIFPIYFLKLTAGADRIFNRSCWMKIFLEEKKAANWELNTELNGSSSPLSCQNLALTFQFLFLLSFKPQSSSLTGVCGLPFEQIMSNLKCDNILKLSPHVANDFPTTKDLPLYASALAIRITDQREIKKTSLEEGEKVGASLDNWHTFSNTCFSLHLFSSRFLLNMHEGEVIIVYSRMTSYVTTSSSKTEKG